MKKKTAIRKLALYKMKSALHFFGVTTDFWTEVNDILRDMERDIKKHEHKKRE